MSKHRESLVITRNYHAPSRNLADVSFKQHWVQERKRKIQTDVATMIHPGTLILRTREERPLLELFFHSLWSTIRDGTKIVLVDDGSSYSVRRLMEQSRPSQIRDCETLVIEHDWPRGSAACVNEAFAHIEGDVVYIVDTDVLLLDNWQDRLQNSLRADPNVGAVGAALLYPQTGGIQHCGVAFSEDVARHLFLNARPAWIASQTISVQAVVFALCALRRTAIDAVGAVDEEYYNAYEDLDYFFRVRSIGYSVVVNPKVQSYHWELSDGPHRNINRKRNLGRFWRLWGHSIQQDIWRFVESGLRAVLADSSDIAIHDLTVIDLCEERPESQRFFSTLSNIASVRLVDYLDMSYKVGKQQEIWLPQILGIDGHRAPNTLLFLVDNFVRLLGNRYWIELRASRGSDDLIADLYGNVVSLRELYEVAWPGSKIR